MRVFEFEMQTIGKNREYFWHQNGNSTHHMRVFSFIRDGYQLKPIEVEVSFMTGIPTIHFLGLPDTVIKESVLRIKSALKTHGYQLPKAQQVIVNLRPAHLKKQSCGIDFAVACAFLWSSGLVPVPQSKNGRVYVYGELGLDGQVSLPDDFDGLLHLHEEETIITGPPNGKPLFFDIFSANSIKDLSALCFHKKATGEYNLVPPLAKSEMLFTNEVAEVLAVLATGEHHAMLAGPAGSGKSTMAEALYLLLKSPNENQFRFSQQIHRIMGQTLHWRPYVCPHHTTTPIAMIGGGAPIFPGEITRAHGGLLVMDEFLEFHPKVQEALREPIEKGEIHISRRGYRQTLPAGFLLVATTNLCPCGDYVPGVYKNCRFSLRKCRSHMERLSGPILDRFDVAYFTYGKREERTVSIQSIKEKVIQAQEFAKTKRNQSCLNRELKANQVEKDLDRFVFENLMPTSTNSLRRRLALLKVARSIADIDQSSTIEPEHIERAAHLSLYPFEKLRRGDP